MTKATSPIEIVLNFIEALNKEDFSAARKLISDDMSFVGVMGKRDGGDTYIEDMKKMRFKYAVHQSFTNGNDVSLWYDINMGGPTILSSGWYHLEDGKISSIKVVFDPRPILKT